MDQKLILRGDFLLIKEVNETGKIEGTNLNILHDDNSHFMLGEIVEVSQELNIEYLRYYCLKDISYQDLQALLAKFKPGRQVIIQRIAKVPYKDGLYFVSFKDILGFITEESEKEPNVKNHKPPQIWG